MPDYTYIGVAVTTVAVFVLYMAMHPDPVPSPAGPPGRHHQRRPPPSGPADCSSPFGSFNGEALGVTAYSNCNDDYISDEDHSVPIASIFPSGVPDGCAMGSCPANVTTGLRWQCVEYGRRFLLTHHQAVFGSVWGAYNIWDLPNVTHYKLTVSMGKGGGGGGGHSSSCRCDAVVRPWQTVPNAASEGVWVQVGDLVIYDRGAVGEYGHVCAVVAVEAIKPANSSSPVALVRIAEENWNNALWPVPSGPTAHSRTLVLVPRKADGRLVLQDQPADGNYPILGVKRY
jgi:hypothetical protein